MIYIIYRAKIAFLFVKKVIILNKYTNLYKVFLKKLVNLLIKQSEINKYAIKLENIR